MASPISRRGYHDVAVAVTARVHHQQVLRQGNRRFHLHIGEQALYTSVGGDDLMFAQLRRLIALMSFELLLYERTFRRLAEQASFGEQAQRLILAAAVHRAPRKGRRLHELR